MRLVFLTSTCAWLLGVTLQAWGQTATWQGGTTWNQPDASFSPVYNSGYDVLFTDLGVNSIAVGVGVTPGDITFTHTSGTYQFNGTPFSASGDLTISGSGAVQFGNMLNTPFDAAWNNTTISNGSTFRFTAGSGSSIGNNSGTIALNNGSLIMGSSAGTFTFNNNISIGLGGGKLGTELSGTSTISPKIGISGNITGSSELSLFTDSLYDNINDFRGGRGLVLSGDNSGFNGAVEIESTATESSPGITGFGRGMVTFANSSAMFSNASHVKVKNGAILAVSYLASASDFANVIAGIRGGIGATGAGGSLASLINPMGFVSSGGILLLDNFNALNNDRLSDSATLTLNSNRIHIIGRNANDNMTNEVVGEITYTGSSYLSIDRPNASDSGVKLTASSLTSGGTGDSLLIDSDNWGTAPSLNNVIVTGTKPVVTNGMITPGIQQFSTGIAGNFMTFSGNNLVNASYVDFSADWSSASPTDIVNVTTSAALSGSGPLNIHALRVQSGTQNLNGRTVVLGSGGLSMYSVSISNGTLDFGTNPSHIGAYNPGAQSHISANIISSGGLTIFGTSQTVNITGNNTGLTGGVFLNGGSTRFSTAGANGQDIVINSFGRLVTAASGTDVVGGVSGDGRISGWIAYPGYSTGTLQITPTSGTHVFNGTLKNGSQGIRVLAITKAGAGIQVFGPDSVATYTGATNVIGGTLFINGNFSGATGDVTVSSGATLGGFGIIGGNTTIQAGGTLSPGYGTGLLTIDADINLAGTAIFELNGLNRGTSYDAVNVGGALTYGGVLQLLIGFGASVGDSFDLFNFNSQSGTFSSLVFNPGYDGTLDYTTGVLTLTAVPEPGTITFLLVGMGLMAVHSFRRLRKV